MENAFNEIYQFKITLKGTAPPVWRRIQVPGSYSLWDLHVAIQDAMGWLDYHLHEFNFPLLANGLHHAMSMNTPMDYVHGPRIGIKCDDFDDDEVIDDREEKMKKWFAMKTPKANYTYDFGDNWKHWIVLEKILPREEGVQYPLCLAGKRQCPPEDCGGVWGFEDICRGRHHAQSHYGKIYDPTEKFDSEEVFFDDPQKRWEEAMDSR